MDERTERPLPPDPPYRAVVGEVANYVEVPSAEELALELAHDPTAPEPAEGEPPRAKRRGPVLTKQQQLQLALWIVEGWDFKDAQAEMLRHWGFTLTAATWRYYRSSRNDLMETATQILESQYLKYGYSTRAVQVGKLVKHAQRLERIIDDRGLYETDVHMVGGRGGKSETVTTEKFAKALSQEYRETIKQINQMSAPVEDAVARRRGRVVETVVTDEEAGRIQEAVGWQLVEAPRDV